MTEDIGIDLDNFSKEAEIAKFSGIRPQGWTLIVRLYMSAKKTPGGIIIPDNSHDNQQFKNFIGLVVAKAKGVYLEERYRDTGPWCEVGDWVMFPRHAGYKIFHKQYPLFVLKEDAIDAVVDNPRDFDR